MHRGWLAAPLLLGCTMENPLFGHSGDDASGTGSATSTTTAADDRTETSLAEGSSAPTSAASSDGGEDSTGNVMTTGASSESGACTLPEPVAVRIDIAPVPTIATDCSTVWSSPMGPISVVGTDITVTDCTCACASEPGGAVTVSLSGVELGEIPECGYIVAWAMPDGLECAWGGIAVFGGLSEPEWIVSRTLVVPVAVFGGLMIDPKPDEICADASCNPAGLYRLEFVGAEGDNTIKMDEEPKVITLPFFTHQPYLVDDVSSVIDDQCHPITAWTADYTG